MCHSVAVSTHAAAITWRTRVLMWLMSFNDRITSCLHFCNWNKTMVRYPKIEKLCVIRSPQETVVLEGIQLWPDVNENYLNYLLNYPLVVFY